MSFINQYLQFLKPEKRVPKNQLKQGNIYRIVRYGGDTKRGINARYVFVIGRVIDKGRIKVHCLKINDIRPAIFVNFLKELRNTKLITENYFDLSSLLKSFDREGSRLFNGYIKNNKQVYNRALGNYRTYFVDKLQYISEVKFEYEELLKLFGEDSNVEKIIEEDSSEND